MGLFDNIRKFFNSDIVNKFKNLYGNNRSREAMKHFCSKKGCDFSLTMPFGQIKYIVENESKILDDYEEYLKGEERKRLKREVKNASIQYPHGFVVLCDKYLKGVLGESVRMPGQVKSKRSQRQNKANMTSCSLGGSQKVYNGQYTHFSYNRCFVSKVEDLQPAEIATLHTHLCELKSEEDRIVLILQREDLINKFEDEVLDNSKRAKYYKQFASSVPDATDEQVYCANHLTELDRFISISIRTEYNRIKSKYPLGAAYIAENELPFGLSKEETIIKYKKRAAFLEFIVPKYEMLKQKYPAGLPAFEEATSYDDGKNSASLPIEEIVKYEDQIKKYEERDRKIKFGVNIEKSQKVYSSKCRKLRDSTLENWGCYIYDIPFIKLKKNGDSTNGKYSVWQMFCDAYSEDDNVDLTYYPRYKKQKETRLKLFKKTVHYYDHVYDKILNFIDKIQEAYSEKELWIIFADSGQNDYEIINKYHFRYLLSKLDEKNIKHASLTQQLDINIPNASYVIVELDSVNSRLIENCSKLLEMTKSNFEKSDMSLLYECQIVYVSLSKGYNREEMLELNKQKEEEIRKQKEDEERKRREEQEESEKRAKAKNIASTYGIIFKQFFPDVSIYSISLSEAETIIALEPKLREFRDFSQRVREAVSGWGDVKGIPYYHFYYYYPTRFTDVTPESRRVREMIYNFKDGIENEKVLLIMTEKLQSTFSTSDLKKFTLVCIPASTVEDNDDRYSSFSSKLCANTGMRNGFCHITITKEKTQSHLGGTDSAEYSYDSDFFKDANVILFDDVVTRGRSMSQMQSALQRFGATVVCAMSIGRTYSDYYGDNRQPHPWTGEY